MAKTEGEAPTPAAAVAVTPPPVRRGRQTAKVDADLVASMKELLDNGQWAGDGILYDDRPAANKAITIYKRALVDAGVTGELAGRTWEEGEKFAIAVGVKA